VTVTLNHTIVPATDKHTSAEFLAAILGLDDPKPWGPFLTVAIPNGVTLDFVDAADFDEHHYAFLVDGTDFDAIFERIRAVGVAFYADPWRGKPGQINHLYGGRGVYFDDPDHHILEVITRPYGDTPEH
jgi:catechol 2,3-dioxygenase-like lactoylglutathione lyase family enzyme